MVDKKKRNYFRIVIIIFILLGILAAVPVYLVNRQLSKIQKTKVPDKPSELEIDEQIYTPERRHIDEQYVNILLLGIDARDVNEPSRSDSMMIATIDKKHKEIKLTSLMRDMIVTMEGHGPMEGLNQDRLNHAYAYGGAPLIIKTVNKNFKTDIKDFVKVDFFGLEKIIDAVGGIPINVKEAEIQYINSYMKEVAKIEKENYIPVTKAGLQTLNGKQAVGYSRIRYVGRSDFERTERQRKVLTEVFKKLVQTKPTDLPSVANTLLPYLETSLDTTEILSLGSFVVINKLNKIDQLRLPIDQHLYDTYVRNTYFLGWNIEPNLEELHKFIYEEDYKKP